MPGAARRRRLHPLDVSHAPARNRHRACPVGGNVGWKCVVGSSIAVDSFNGRRLWRRAVEASKTEGAAEIVCASFGAGWRLPTMEEASSLRNVNEEPTYPPHACNPPMDNAVFTTPWWNPPCGPGQCPIKMVLTSTLLDGGPAAAVLIDPLQDQILWQDHGTFYCTHDPL